MINRKSLLLFLLISLVSHRAYADVEFYGIQMRDEQVASGTTSAPGFVCEPCMPLGRWQPAGSAHDLAFR